VSYGDQRKDFRIYKGSNPRLCHCRGVLEEGRHDNQFTGSSKVYLSTLIKRLITEKYSRAGVRDHILRMSNVASRLRPLDLAIKDGFLIYLSSTHSQRNLKHLRSTTTP
jgi:hypothetical protein